MNFTCLLINMMAATLIGQAGTTEGESLVELIESLQPRLEDFRCEFEGTQIYTEEQTKRYFNLNADGLADTFGGVFVWRSGGDTYMHNYHRREPGGKVDSELLVIRMAKNEAELYQRDYDEPIGRTVIDDPQIISTDRPGSFGGIFVRETLKALISSPEFQCTVADESVDGVKLKAVTFADDDGKRPFRRFWIDLKRGGHAVRAEQYGKGGVVDYRVDVQLASFPVGDTKIWMPISGVVKSYIDTKDDKIGHSSEPTAIQTIYINHGTLEFNKHPDAKAFTIEYKPGTPVSDNIRRLKYEFGQQRMSPLPSRAEATAMLKEQLANAEAQHRELIATSPARSSTEWKPWLTLGFGASAVLLSLTLLIRRRMH
jgi:hypothetical protein